LTARWNAALKREEYDEHRAMRLLARELGLPRADIRRRLQAAGLVDGSL
jgi:hypothetical protein